MTISVRVLLPFPLMHDTIFRIFIVASWFSAAKGNRDWIRNLNKLEFLSPVGWQKDTGCSQTFLWPQHSTVEIQLDICMLPSQNPHYRTCLCTAQESFFPCWAAEWSWVQPDLSPALTQCRGDRMFVCYDLRIPTAALNFAPPKKIYPLLYSRIILGAARPFSSTYTVLWR